MLEPQMLVHRAMHPHPQAWIRIPGTLTLAVSIVRVIHGCLGSLTILVKFNVIHYLSKAYIRELV
jgi:hypothetical protein